MSSVEQVAELATMLAPKLPRPAEAKKAFANLFAAPGVIKAARNHIKVQLDPAGNRAERGAFGELMTVLNRLGLSMPGDQQARAIRFTLAPR